MTKKTTIFKLTAIDYRRDDCQYPEFDVCRYPSYYSSLDNAVRAIPKIIAPSRFGFLIEEHEVDGDHCDISFTTKSRRNFLPDGSPWDENLLNENLWHDAPDFEEFLGRSPDRLRFGVGDMVEALDRYADRVTLKIICGVAMSPLQVRERHEEHRSAGCFFPFDYLCDGYLTLNLNGEQEVHDGAYLFPPRFPVSDELRSKLNEKLNFKNVE